MGHGLQRVDVEAGVRLVEEREGGLEHVHLQHLEPLLLAAGEALVHGPRDELIVHLKELGLLLQELSELRDRHVVLLVTLHAPGVDRRTQEARHRDARDGDGVLEREEHPPTGPLVDRKREQVLAVIRDRTARHLVPRVAHHREGERALPRTVRAHDRMHFATAHGEIDALEDLLALDGDVEVLDLQGRH